MLAFWESNKKPNNTHGLEAINTNVEALSEGAPNFPTFLFFSEIHM
jgi:hypothetical protein